MTSRPSSAQVLHMCHAMQPNSKLVSVPAQENQGLDFQTFFDLLQRIAEARGLMDPQVAPGYSLLCHLYYLDSVVRVSDRLRIKVQIWLQVDAQDDWLPLAAPRDFAAQYMVILETCSPFRKM